MIDSLEQALDRLDFDVPDGLVDRAVAGAAQTPAQVHISPQVHIATRSTLARVAAVVVAMLFVNLVAAYFAPRYGQALADAPIVGGVTSPVLRYSGLDASQVTHLNVSATSAGHTIKLVGAFADTERTVVLMEVDGRPHGLPNKQEACCYAEGTLVDQFAVEYQRVYSPDALTMTFKPLVGPASQVGARLQLHITALHGLRPEFQPINGDWSLNVTLIQQAGTVLAIPAPVTANGIKYTIRSVRLSGMQVSIQFYMSGQPVEEYRKLVYSGQTPQPAGLDGFYQRYIATTLVDAHGNQVSFNESGFTLPRQGALSGGMTVVVPGPGLYNLTFGNAPGGPSFQIDIP